MVLTHPIEYFTILPYLFRVRSYQIVHISYRFLWLHLQSCPILSYLLYRISYVLYILSYSILSYSNRQEKIRIRNTMIIMIMIIGSVSKQEILRMIPYLFRLPLGYLCSCAKNDRWPSDIQIIPLICHFTSPPYICRCVMYMSDSDLERFGKVMQNFRMHMSSKFGLF